MPPSGDARFSAAAEVRALVHALSAHDGDDGLLGTIGDTAGALAAALREHPRRERLLPQFDGLEMGEIAVPADVAGGRHPMDDRGIAGAANPAAVELTTRREGDDAVADVEFGPAFEGAPGRVHGGMVAAVFDDLVGFFLAVVREPGFTGRLTVEYRAPVPTETVVEFRAWMRGRDGRKLFVDAEAKVGDKVLAVAEAAMILVRPEHWSTHARELLD